MYYRVAITRHWVVCFITLKQTGKCNFFWCYDEINRHLLIQKIIIPFPQRFFGLNSHPSWISLWAPFFPFGSFHDLLWGGYGTRTAQYRLLTGCFLVYKLVILFIPWTSIRLLGATYLVHFSTRSCLEE